MMMNKTNFMHTCIYILYIYKSPFFIKKKLKDLLFFNNKINYIIIIIIFFIYTHHSKFYALFLKVNSI